MGWHWFRRGWWQYLLAGGFGWRRFWCRAAGHQAGPVWYRAYGDSPDMHCRNCGDDLG
jgi:hypothetical protein